MQSPNIEAIEFKLTYLLSYTSKGIVVLEKGVMGFLWCGQSYTLDKWSFNQMEKCKKQSYVIGRYRMQPI